MAKRPILPPSDNEAFEEEESAVETSDAESEPIAKKSAKSKKAAPVKKSKPLSKSKSKKRADEDEDEEEDEEDEEPAPKKRKTDKGKAKIVKNTDNNEPETGNSTVKSDNEGGKYIDLSNKRRATVREFKGVTFLDIREFYTKDGEHLPGKKGISLSLEQWQVLKQHMDTIDSLFAKKK